QLGNCGFDGRFLIGRQFLAILFQLLFRLEHQAIGHVHFLYTLAYFLVGFFVGFGLVLHFLYLLFAQAATCLNTYVLLFAGAFIFRTYIQYTIGIYIESYLNLWYATRCGWNTVQYKTSQRFVVFRHRALTLY